MPQPKMNYLAHAILSGPDPQWILGSFLGDHVRGRDWQAYPPAVARGILLHRRIDVFTDAHPAFATSRARLSAPFRRYAGIVLDMFYDYFLARRFFSLTGRHLETFAGTCYANLAIHQHLLPDSLRRFASYQQQHNLLVNYANKPTLDQSLRAVASRMRRPGPLADGLPELVREEAGLESDFLALWPDLTRLAEREREVLANLPLD